VGLCQGQHDKAAFIPSEPQKNSVENREYKHSSAGSPYCKTRKTKRSFTPEY
jgi:hypothetical protein